MFVTEPIIVSDITLEQTFKGVKQYYNCLWCFTACSFGILISILVAVFLCK